MVRAAADEANAEGDARSAAAQAAGAIPCESQGGIAAGACHRTCSSNGNGHAACDAAYRSCMDSCH